MDCLTNALETFCLTHGFDKTYWVGYSGGLDSHVLLHLLAELRSRYPLKLHAIHVHHGLSPNADAWVAHCTAICNLLQVDLTIHKIHIDTSIDKSPEELAREGRYHVFAGNLAQNDVLVTAQHQDDQAETVLLQLLRGAGPKGLAAMPALKQFAKGYHARPLLSFTRADVRDYAEQHKLHWIEDESNINTDFTRNFLRHDILPILKNRWPSVTQVLSRVADNCAEAQQLLDEMAAEDLRMVTGSLPLTLSIKKLLTLSPMRQRQVVRYWLSRLRFPIPSAIKLQQIQHDMLRAREDKAPHIDWSGVELRRYRDDLYALHALSQHDSAAIFEWDLSQSLYVQHIGLLEATLQQGQGLRADIKTVLVRFRRGGETIQLPGREHHHTLKNLFQEWNVPTWMRDRIPLLYVDEELAAVAGYAVAKNYVAKDETLGWTFSIKK